jgi:hypothetical protein
MEELEVTIEAVIQVIGTLLEPRLQWKTVAIDDTTVWLGGQLIFEVGETIVDDNGKDIEVTPDVQDYMNKMIRVGVPIELAEGGNVQDIVDYLKRVEMENQEAIEKMVTPVPEYKTENLAIDTVHDLAGEFRSAGLTKAQIESMIMFAKQATGKIN